VLFKPGDYIAFVDNYRSNSDDDTDFLSRFAKYNNVWTQPNISNCIFSENDEDFIKIFKYIPANITNSTVKIIIGNGSSLDCNKKSVNNNNNNNSNNITNDTTARAAAYWVKDNTPAEREKTSEYYKRYASSNISKICPTQFGPLVKSLGFISKHSGNIRFWTKK
jgi:hypothetical protein